MRRTLDLDKIIQKDQLGCEIANYWMEWNGYKEDVKARWDELRRYLFATDTRSTSNAKLPWKNTTTIPKLCQIRDNLQSNYIAYTFPQSRWLRWEAFNKDANTKNKRDTITAYMQYVISQPSFKAEFNKCLLDYIDYGNAFAMVDWEDQRVEGKDSIKVGYVGPVIRRISPLDIVFNPTTDAFENSPKIIRSLVTKGDAKKLLKAMSTSDTQPAMEELWQYMREVRESVSGMAATGELKYQDAFLDVDGFGNFRDYLNSNYVELLYFYGDLYDEESDELLENYIIVVVDRHKVLLKVLNPSTFGRSNIFHVGWRVRQDNLWAMGPLENLVGLQYRVDHLENMKSDLLDLTTLPPLKIKGSVDAFEWGPMAKIFTSEEGDVELMSPEAQALSVNTELQMKLMLMEELAGSPREAMGFRTPGEKTAFEVQRMENAASRIFHNKTRQCDEQFTERIMNCMLEMACRKQNDDVLVTVFDDEFKINTFRTIKASDISGAGRIRAVGARHFAETAEMVQSLTNFYQTAIGQDPDVRQHISAIRMAQVMFDDLLEMKDYSLVIPYIRLAEQADAQKQVNALQEMVSQDAATPTGIGDDYDVEPGQQAPQPPQGVPQ